MKCMGQVGDGQLSMNTSAESRKVQIKFAAFGGASSGASNTNTTTPNSSTTTSGTGPSGASTSTGSGTNNAGTKPPAANTQCRPQSDSPYAPYAGLLCSSANPTLRFGLQTFGRNDYFIWTSLISAVVLQRFAGPGFDLFSLPSGCLLLVALLQSLVLTFGNKDENKVRGFTLVMVYFSVARLIRSWARL